MQDMFRTKPQHLLWEAHYWAARAKVNEMLILFVCFQIWLQVKINGL